MFYKNYDSSHLFTIFEEINSLCPNTKTLNNFFDKNSNKQPDETSLLIENAVFFNSFTSYHNHIQHVFLDFTKSINFFYDLLKENESCKIIIEFIPHGQLRMWGTHYDPSFNDISKINLDKIIQFIRGINLNNEIIILSDVDHFQNFESNSIFIKNLNTISFEENDKIINWTPTLSNFIKNKNDGYFGDLMDEIIKKQNRGVNNHYELYNQKYCILEKRTTSAHYTSTRRNLTNEEYEKLHNLLLYYCNNNNLKLLIWDSEITNKSVYEQFNICNNAEIIVGFGGSFFIFNYSFVNTNILLMNYMTEYFEQYEVLYNQIYFLNPCFNNKNLKNMFIHFINVQNTNYSVILDDFLKRI